MHWPFGKPKPLGQRGEALARRFLRRAGMKILARNYRCPNGEIDLIALDRSTRAELGAETIAFVEVKTRSDDRYVSPASAVDDRKQKQVRRAAGYYLAHYPTAGYAIRFDVISIVLPEPRDDGQGERTRQEPRIEHIRGAF